ncbi:TIR domain-containing protein [Streptomyces sp. AC550_RSS872]|uniref:TIR domain-containing protein n=1 Tax=Streptomyces sp. AC550_RSS872 TaxID=2823689 RepID=UPI001C27B208|nr:TIR domain-containing protein [Streptomyces sp. AC550_RSS872]
MAGSEDSERGLADLLDAPDLEAVTRASAGRADAGELARAVDDARRRVAVVEVEGRPVGTGVLVQPDVLLTAGHVLRHALVPGRRPKGATAARFDFHGRASAGLCGAGITVRLTELLGGGPDTEDGFALLRTDGPVPPAECCEGSAVPRGHYALDPAPYDLRAGIPLLLLHHPLGTRLRAAVPAVTESDSEGAHIHYRNVRTARGSGGAPLVDVQGRLVGIHEDMAGAVGRGPTAAAVASAVKNGPHPWIADLAAVVPGPTHGPAIMLSWVAEDRSWAQRVHAILAEAGHRVFLEPDSGVPGHRTVREHVEGGGRVFAVVSPAYLADSAKTAERDFVVHDLDHATARSRLVPLLVEGEATGSVALLSPVDLRGTQDTDLPGRLTSAAPPARAPLPAAAAPDTAGAARDAVLAFRPDDPLPRLQRLSARARRAAGTVSGTVFADGEHSQFEAGLYVTRDLEEELLELLDADRDTPLVVTGDAGCGKTSLLWSLARRRCEPGGEVFFLKATWLVPDDTGTTRVDQEMLLASIAQARRDGRTVTVLIDTVDVVVNSDSAWDTLVTVVESAAADAAVVLTSRVAEAKELPSSWRQRELSDYSTQRGPDAYATSEFDRAVLAHSAFFSSDPEIREDLITGMLTIAARDISLNPLCLRPLTLRMLFEIYTPARVPDVVDTTGLYEAYWEHRVARDRRSWDRTGIRAEHEHEHEQERDLGAAAMALALEMLRTGVPEARVDRVRLPDSLTSQDLGRDIALLVRRGVGQLSGGVFQFFHQTFFEYAASRALVHRRGGAGLRALVRHLRGLPGDDYFLLAVLEQAWLCADRPQSVAPAAEKVLGELLREFARATDDTRDPLGDHPVVRYGLRRAVLSVCAQSSLLTDELMPDLLRLLGSADGLPLPALRQFLALLPSPARPYGRRDIAVLTTASRRSDLAWITVLEVLERLLPRDSAQVLDTVAALELVERAVAGEEFLSTRGELARFLVSLLRWEPEQAGPLVTEVAAAALDRSGFQYVAQMLTRMATLADGDTDPSHWADWANAMIGDTTVTSTVLIRAHTAVLLPHLHTLDLPELVDRLTALVTRLRSGTEPTTADRSLLGGLLTAIATASPADADPAPVVDLLVRITRREHVTDLSHGALVRLLASDTPVGSAVRDLAVQWLRDGMPVKGEDDNLAEARAKVVRTALGQLDLPLPYVADVAGRAATSWTAGTVDPKLVWQGRECLRPLLVRGAAAGIPEAGEVLQELPGGFRVSGPDITTWADPFGRHTPTAHETGVLADLLLRMGELDRLRTLLAQNVTLEAGTLDRLTRSTLTDLRAQVPKTRPRTMNQQTRTGLRSLTSRLAAVAHTGATVPLAWPELSGWIRRVPDGPAVGWLVELVGAGLTREAYPPDEALRLLRGVCGAEGDTTAGPDSTATIDCVGEDGRRARRWCLWWYGVHGTVDDVEEMFRLAFTEPVDEDGLIEISEMIVGDIRTDPLTGDDALDLLLRMGRGLKNGRLGSAPLKKVARAWRAAMRTVVPGCGVAGHLRLFEELPLLEDRFAARLLHYVPVSRNRRVQTALDAVAVQPGFGSQVQKAVHKILDERRRAASEGGWPHLFRDLEHSDL